MKKAIPAAIVGALIPLLLYWTGGGEFARSAELRETVWLSIVGAAIGVLLSRLE